MNARLAVPLALLLGCSHQPKRTPGEDYLKTIRVNGNNKLSSKTLVAGLAIKRAQKAGRPPDPYQVQVDGDRIRGKYLRQGYLDVDVRPRVERAGDATTVIYDIEEGVRATTRVVIRGLPADPDITREKVRKAIPLADGAPFSYAAYDAAKESLMRVIEDAGYAHAKLETTVYADRSKREAVIVLDYTPGPKCVFGPITVTGVSGGLADAVRERVQFAQGDQYSTRAIAATQRALYALGRFSTVQVQPAKNDNPVVDVAVSVTEGSRRMIELGGGFGLDPQAYEVRGRAGYQIAGWPYQLDTATVDLRPAYAIMRESGEYVPRIRALAKIERQDVLWTYSRGEVEVGYNYLATLPFTSYGPRARLGFSTPLIRPRVNLRVGWGIERLDFREISPAIDPALQMQLGLDRPQRVGVYTQALSVELRDHPIQPTQGAYAEVRVSEGTKFAGSAYDYVQIVPDLRGYVPLWRPTGTVLAGRARAGAIYGEIPVTERLFSGGASSHRGFGERVLAPFVLEEDGDDIPYGGGAMLELGLEARTRIGTLRKIPIGGVLFLDGGDVTERVSQIDLGKLHWAAGLGIRFHTIVGPVRVDLGYRLNRVGELEPGGTSRFAFHLSLGEAF
jgi:outer membrane protein assembly factor BamA